MLPWISLTCRIKGAFRIPDTRRFNLKVFSINEIIISWDLRTNLGVLSPPKWKEGYYVAWAQLRQSADFVIILLLNIKRGPGNRVQQLAYGISNKIASEGI